MKNAEEQKKIISKLYDYLSDEMFEEFVRMYNERLSVFLLPESRLSISYYKRRKKLLFNILSRKKKYLMSIGYYLSNVTKEYHFLGINVKIKFYMVENKDKNKRLIVNPFICSIDFPDINDFIIEAYNNKKLSFFIKILENNL